MTKNKTIGLVANNCATGNTGHVLTGAALATYAPVKAPAKTVAPVANADEWEELPMAGTTEALATNRRVALVDVGLRAQRRVLDADWSLLPMSPAARASGALYANSRKGGEPSAIAGDDEFETMPMPSANWGNQ